MNLKICRLVNDKYLHVLEVVSNTGIGQLKYGPLISPLMKNTVMAALENSNYFYYKLKA